MKRNAGFIEQNAVAMIACHANVPYALTLVCHGVLEYGNGMAYTTNKTTDMLKEPNI